MKRKLNLRSVKRLETKQSYFNLNKKHDILNEYYGISHRSNKSNRIIFKDGFINSKIMENNVSVKGSYGLDKQDVIFF